MATRRASMYILYDNPGENREDAVTVVTLGCLWLRSRFVGFGKDSL